ncbi:MAG: TOBE domain-containing protein [Dysosmobacter sp.]
MNLYTADFIGNPSINFVKGTAQVEAGGMRVDSPLGQMGFRAGRYDARPRPSPASVRCDHRRPPEQLSISRRADRRRTGVEGHVYSGMPAGSETLVSVRVGDTMLTVKELGSTHYASDEPVYLGFNPKKVNVFETKSENLIKYC